MRPWISEAQWSRIKYSELVLKLVVSQAQFAVPIADSRGQRSTESDSRKIGFETVGLGTRSDHSNISVRANEHIRSGFHPVRSLELAIDVTELQPVPN